MAERLITTVNAARTTGDIVAAIRTPVLPPDWPPYFCHPDAMPVLFPSATRRRHILARRRSAAMPVELGPWPDLPPIRHPHPSAEQRALVARIEAEIAARMRRIIIEQYAGRPPEWAELARATRAELLAEDYARTLPSPAND